MRKAKSYSMEQLETYEKLLIQSNSNEEFQNRLNLDDKEIPTISPLKLIVEYFGGYIDEQGKLPEHDIPSLVVFDTNSLQVIEQRSQRMFYKETIKEETIMPDQAAKSFVGLDGIRSIIDKTEEEYKQGSMRIRN